jgi:small subunit ribosomal protein S8e
MAKLGRKKTGGKYLKRRKRRKHETKGQKIIVKLSDKNKRKSKRIMGGNKRTFLTAAKFVNVIDKNKKARRIEIKNVLETPSNRFLARQNVITKGTIIETELGKVKITNRPTQEAVINGVLIE